MALAILTETQAKLIRAVPESNSVPVYELASVAQLTPTEVGNIVSQLVAKHLAELLEGERAVKLTGEGRRVQQSLRRREKEQLDLTIAMEDIVVVPDELVVETEKSAGADEADIDSALDAEISSRSEVSA